MNPDERVAPCPDDEALEVSKIEVEFAIPVKVTGYEYRAFRLWASEVAHVPWNQPRDGVHWLSEEGSRPQWSQVDAMMLGKPLDPGAPAAGEPTYDDSVLYFGTAARGFNSDKERRREERDRGKPVRMHAHNDAIGIAMREAAKRFGGDDGTFNAAGFSHAFMRMAGLNGVLDGHVVRLMLCGRRDVEILPDGAHFRLRRSW